MSCLTTWREIFTREDVTHEQWLFARTADEFMHREVLPRADRLDAHDWSVLRTLLERAGALGLLGMEIPVAYGGLGLDRISAAVVAERTSISPSFALALGGHAGIGTLPLIYFGTEEQKQRYLPRLARGELVAAYALTEPDVGSDAMAVRTRASRSPDGEHYILNGQKAWITNGGLADLFTVFARVDGAEVTAFLVERSMGVRSGREERKMGLDGSSTTTLTFEDVRVPSANVLGGVGEGRHVAFDILSLGRAKLGIRNIAWAKQALAQAAQYAAKRTQFGRPIDRFGLIRHKLAAMAARCYVGDAMTFRVLGAIDTAVAQDRLGSAADRTVLAIVEQFSADCSICKVWTSEALGEVVDETLQIHGANGYSREFAIERAYRDARVTRIFEGTNEINRLLVAGKLIREPATSLRDDGDEANGSALPHVDVLGAARRLWSAALDGPRPVDWDEIKHEQELLGALADVAIEHYALKSASARTEKLLAGEGPREKAALAVDALRVYTTEAVDRLVRAGRSIAGAGPRREHTTALRKILSELVATNDDWIGAARRLADAATSVGGAPL